jgi:conjugative transfer signal peptidase TraF
MAERQLPVPSRIRRSVLGAGFLIAAVAALGATLVWSPPPLLVWNVSASAPVGLYAIGSGEEVRPGDMVLAHVPASWRRLAGERRYIPLNVPLVKRVAAAEGDTVCAYGRRLLVNGYFRAERRRRDSLGRILPWWSGCITLDHGAVLLLMDNPASFDGRYFGPTPRRDIIGRAGLLWRG